MASPAAVLSVLVTANTSNATRGLMRFNTQLGATQTSANRALGAVKTMAKGAAIGTGIGLGYAVKKAADFEQQLDSLGSVSGATGREMEKLRKQAMKAGADTKFSALDAAKAQTELAKGGASVAQIAKGGLKSALALAAAGELDLALAAETSANAMNLFKLEGKDAMKVADQLATAANATTADVEDFAVALKMGGSVAKMAGLSFGETVLALEALAKIGIRNSDAGTSLKTSIIQLLKPTAKQAELTEKLGLNFINAEGRMKSMSQISAMLRAKLGGMTDAQRTATLATLAGTDGVRTLSALYDAGPAKLDKWKKGLDKSGTAAKVAAEKQDNLKGKLENLQGSIETAAIALGSKMLPALTDAAKKVTDIINDPKLTSSEKLDKLAKMLGDAFSKGLAIAADKAAQIAPVAAKAFVTGWLSAGIWGRLVIGGWLISKMGGFKAFGAMGGKAGTAFGTGFSATAATTGGKGGMLAGFLGKAKSVLGKAGIAALIATIFGPSVVDAVTQPSKKMSEALEDLDAKARKVSGGGFQAYVKALREQIRLAKTAGTAIDRDIGDALERFGQKTFEVSDRIKRMSGEGSRSVKELRTRVAYNTGLIRERLGKDTKAGKEALSQNFAAAAENVRKSMKAGTISTKRGTALIEMYMVKALQSMGFSKADALALRGRGKGSTQTPGPGGGGQLIPHQRGAYIDVGKPTGDSVPSLLERGEYVLNRNAVKKVGRRNLDRLNFAAAPRFQQGGMAGMVAAANKLDQAQFPYVWGGGHSGSPAPFGPMDCSGAVSFVLQHGGVNIPTMVSGALAGAGKPGAGKVTVFANASHTFMRIGNRYFGTSGSNPGGGAGWFPDPGAGYRAGFAERHFGVGGDFFTKVPRVLVDGPGSMLKGVVQGSLDTTRAAANESLRQLSMTSIGSGDAGDPGPGWGKQALRRLWVRANDGLGDPGLMAAIALAESGGNPAAHNPSGASGLWQILGEPFPGDVFDPLTNARMAGAKLRSQGLGAWEAYTNGNYQQFLQKGGLAGSMNRAVNIVGGLNRKGKRFPAKRRSKVLHKFLDRIKGIGLPEGLEKNLKLFQTDAEIFGDMADRAGQLTIDDGEGNSIQGVVAGLSEGEWLNKQLEALFKLRNALIRAQEIVMEKRERIAKLVEAARERLGKIADQIRAAAAIKRGLEKQLDEAKKHPKVNAALIKDLKGKIHGIDRDQGVRTRERDVLKDRVLPTLTGQREKLGSSLRDDIRPGIDAVQGVGSPMDRFTSLPAVGVLGGDIFAVQMRLRDLAEKPASITDTSTGESESADLLRQLLREANLRTAVSQAQYEVFKNMPFAGSFATGGVVPGPIGSPAMAVVHGGEAIGQPGGVQVIVWGDIINTPRGKRPVEVVGSRQWQQEVRNVRFRPSGPARGGGWG